MLFLEYVFDFSCILTCFGDTQGVLGARFGEYFGSSKNDPKKLGICQGTLISYFGIIETPSKPLKKH